MSKSDKKILAIKNLPTPKSIDDVRRFLEMISYYSRFIPICSTLTASLRYLTKKNSKCIWSSKCNDIFIKIKNEISSDRVLVPHNPDLPIILTCDLRE